MSKNYPSFCQKCFSRVVRNEFYVSRGKFWGKKGITIEKKAFSPLCPLCEKIWIFPQNVFSKLLKTSFYLPRYFFQEKFCDEHKMGEISRRDDKNHCHQQRYTGEALLTFLKVSGFDDFCLKQASRSFFRTSLSHSNKVFVYGTLCRYMPVFGKDNPSVRWDVSG